MLNVTEVAGRDAGAACPVAVNSEKRKARVTRIVMAREDVLKII
jgi:hypothetical protein